MTLCYSNTGIFRHSDKAIVSQARCLHNEGPDINPQAKNPEKFEVFTIVR